VGDITVPDGNGITYATAGSWKEQRDRARRDAIQHIAEARTAITAAEDRIDTQLLVLRDLEMTFDAIAEATGMTVSIVQNRCKRAQEG